MNGILYTVSFDIFLCMQRKITKCMVNIWIPIGKNAATLCIRCSNRGVTFTFISPQTSLWPVELFCFQLDFDTGSFGCCCVWKSEEKWARTLWASK